MTDRARKRWRLPLRVFFLLTLLAAIYFAVGRVTKSRGERDVVRHLAELDDRPKFSTQFVAPLIYRNDSVTESSGKQPQETTRQDYYLWFFGYVGKLPLETHQTRTLSVAVEEEFEEMYFPINSSSSRHRTAIPVGEWREQHGESPLVPLTRPATTRSK